jgi:hypothetical protein
VLEDLQVQLIGNLLAVRLADLEQAARQSRWEGHCFVTTVANDVFMQLGSLFGLFIVQPDR